MTTLDRLVAAFARDARRKGDQLPGIEADGILSALDCIEQKVRLIRENMPPAESRGRQDILTIEECVKHLRNITLGGKDGDK